MDCSTPGFSVHHQLPSLLKLLSIKLVIPSNHLIFCHPIPLLPSIFPSIRVFSIDSFLHIRWPKYWSFNFSISPSNEYSGLISFRMDWFDLLYLYMYMFMYICILNKDRKENSAFLSPYSPRIASDLQWGGREAGRWGNWPEAEVVIACTRITSWESGAEETAFLPTSAWNLAPHWSLEDSLLRQLKQAAPCLDLIFPG